MRFENRQSVATEIDTKIKILDAHEDSLGLCAADTERIKKLVRDLQDGGTGEAKRAIQDSVSDARDTIRTKFDAQYDETTREQAEAQRLEQYVQDEVRSDADNAARITDARADLHTDEAREPLDQTSSELKEEAEVLDAEADRMRERREQSLREAERLLRQVMRDID